MGSSNLRMQTCTCSWWLLYFSAFIIISRSQNCIPYDASSFTSLHCSPRLSPCSLVTPSTSTLSLEQTESQLGNILSQAEAGVSQSELSQDCLEGFSTLYCLQAYTICGQGGGVCEDECRSVVYGACGGGGWAYLSRIIDQLRAGGLVDLQSLAVEDYCNGSRNSTYNGEMCLSLQDDNCSISTTSMPGILPITTPPAPSSVPSSIIAVAVAVSVILVLIVFLTVAALLLLNFSGFRNRKEPANTPTKSSAQQSRKPSNVEIPYPMGSLAERQERRQSSGTLMMRASDVHEVLLNPAPPTRSTTLARRLNTDSFLRLPAKKRLKQLEYPRGNICLLRDLWETNFGPVYLGEASGLDPNEDLSSVLIKSLRDRASSKLKQQFTLEMTWASSFNHAHIISLLGVCTKEDPQYMIYEYLDYGSLKEFLLSIGSMSLDFDQFLGDAAVDASNANLADLTAITSGPVFGVEDLASMARQVANGMSYLSKKAFILKDLAARNCQVGQNLVVKIADFGLNYDRTSNDYCYIRSHKTTPVPLRWLSPEALRSNRYSVYSDIWAFGILLWEIFAFGARPYGDLTNAQVAKCILERRLLQAPDKCPEWVYELMKRCWNQQPNERPWFHSMEEELSEKLQEYGEKTTTASDVVRALRQSISN